MSNVIFELEIRGGEIEGEISRFRPGEVLQGSVRIVPETELNARHVYVRLKWRTEGRGDRDEGVISVQDIHQGVMRAETPLYHSFHFKLPDHPWSYAGHYVNIVWEIEALIDLPLARDPRDQKAFILAPD